MKLKLCLNIVIIVMKQLERSSFLTNMNKIELDKKCVCKIISIIMTVIITIVGITLTIVYFNYKET